MANIKYSLLILIYRFIIYAVRSNASTDCSNGQFECCPDGKTQALGPNFQGCSQEAISNIQSILDEKYSSKTENLCALPEPKSSCYEYKMQWRYSMKNGRCVQYWYGGCDGNANSFDTLEECEGKCIKPNGTEVCQLELVNPVDLCQYNETRFFYDKNVAQCKQFIYGGCLGNENNFRTLEECERRCQIPLVFEQCSLTPDKGPCFGDHQRWFYDTQIGRCTQFTYGGCLKNKNNFKSEEECANSCIKPKQKAVCLLPKIRGTCNEDTPSFYYDFISSKCTPFPYSGCEGNLNRFPSLDTCQKTCQSLSQASYTQQLISTEVCNAPKLPGQCHLKLQRWYFNNSTQMCHQFTYSGCDGNANNFETEPDCRRSCKAREVQPCVLPVEAGTCSDYKIFWYFNQVDRECVRFYYGGCDGNQNRFDSREVCEFTCKLSEAEKKELLKLPGQCIAPIDYGKECHAPTRKWHFDVSAKACFTFDYTGCSEQVTSNRFDELEECESKCVVSGDVEGEVVMPVEVETDKLDEIIICDQAMEVGNCSQRISKWFYDKEAKYCREFTFSGCNGNSNKFETREQCTNVCEEPKRREICHANKFQGPCIDFQTRWYHDTVTKSCQQFSYGGCLENENNFNSKASCVHFCWLYLSDEARNTDVKEEMAVETTTKVADDEDVCKLEKREGIACGRYGPTSSDRWYFEKGIRACQKFLYAGCGGNGNNFIDLDQCEKKCKNNTHVLDISNLRNDNPCDTYVDIEDECVDEATLQIFDFSSMNLSPHLLTWFYDLETRSCRQIKKTCIFDEDKNINKFDSFTACKNQCLPKVTSSPTQDDCYLPIDIGNKCSYQIWRWYYDSSSGECHQFSYSGCLGNNNNFPTYQKCLWLCASIGTIGCPPLTSCDKLCPHGKQTTQQGCEICECSEPCKSIKCSESEKCVVKDKSTAVCEILLVEPSIEDLPVSVELYKYGRLVLPCKASGRPEPTISWFKDRLEIVFEAFDGRVILGQNGTLIVVNVSESDSGVYSCRAISLGKSVVKETKVVVKVSNFLIRTVASYEKYAMFGRDVIMECYITGDPIPQISWRTNKFKIKTNPYKYLISNKTLTIKRFHFSDIDIYTCVAENGIDRPLNQSIDLKRAIPGKVAFKSYSIGGEINSTVLLECNHTGMPSPTINWHTPTNHVINLTSSENPKFRVVNSSYLEIKKLSINDIGTYKCFAVNQFTYKSNKDKFGSANLTVYFPPVIVSKFSKFYSPYSSNIVLKCESEGLPKPEITWYKDNTLLLNKNKPMPSYKYQFSLENGSLAIFDLNSNDEGVYYCYASSLAIFPVSSLNYTVKVIKSLVKKSQVTSVNETDNVLLNCQIPSEVKVSAISWTFNETIKLTTPKTGPDFYSIKNIQSNQAGIYECHAQANLTDYLTKIDLTVKNLPLTTEKKLKEISTTKSSSVVLDCTWWFTTSLSDIKNMPGNLTKWTLNDADLIDSVKYEYLNSYRTILRVNHLGVNDSSNVYTCRFSLKKNQVKISEFRLFVGVAPFAVSESALRNNNSQLWSGGEKTVSFDCPLSGVPDVVKMWYLNGEALGQTGDRIVIERLNREMEGFYTCNASNEFGYEILRYEASLAVEMRIKTDLDSVINAERSDNIVIICEFNQDAKPEPVVSWFFNSTPIYLSDNQKYSGNKNVLSVRNVELNDSGEYTCVLSNGYHPEQRFAYKLRVHDLPVVKFVPERPIFRIGAEQAKIACTLDNKSDSIERIFWYKNNGLLKPNGDKYVINNGELKILKVQAEDAGRYICKVRIGGSYVRGRVNIELKGDEDECEDLASYSNCHLVVKTQSLCIKWGKFCCRSCKQAGYRTS